MSDDSPSGFTTISRMTARKTCLSSVSYVVHHPTRRGHPQMHKTITVPFDGDVLDPFIVILDVLAIPSAREPL
jgi:hypothetical protein